MGVQLVPLLACGDLLDGYVGLVMESGNSDLEMYLSKTKLSRFDKLSIGQKVCSIIENAHSIGYVLMDLKPSNVVLIFDKISFITNFKAIDFDNSCKVGEDISATATATPRYVTPEIAKVLLGRMKGEIITTKANTAIDVFAFGLIIWELENDNNSLWGILGINLDNSNAILTCAATITDKIIHNAIEKTFKGDMYINLRSFLKDALAVNPAERWPAKKLMNNHSLFGNKAATLNLADSVTRIETKMDRVSDKIDEIEEIDKVLLLFKYSLIF